MASVPYSCKSVSKLATATCKEPIRAAIFFFSISTEIVTCHLSNHLSEYMYFYKVKTLKISCRKVKISISPWGGNFHFSARGESYVYLKKISPRGEFHLAYV